MTALNKTKRFIAPGISKVYYLKTIAAATLIPTRAEITSGTDLTAEVGDMNGWQPQTGTVETPDLGSRFTSKVGGRTSVDDSSLTFYADQSHSDIRLVQHRDDTGFIVFAWEGDVIGGLASVFPVTVISTPVMITTGEDAVMIEVSYSITATPAENIPLPAPS